MMQGKTGWWIAGICASVVLVSMGYGMGKRARSPFGPEVNPAGAPLPSIQIEPIQPQEELAAISASPSASASGVVEVAAEPAISPGIVPTGATAGQSQGPAPLEESARVRQIQVALKAAGFDPGPIDGKLGPRTRTAILDFQRAQGLQADGKVGPKTWSKLEPYLKTGSPTSD